jgi:hypothetical protein
VALATSSRRKHSQAELGVISQMCVVTAAAELEEPAEADHTCTAVAGSAVDASVEQKQQPNSNTQKAAANGRTGQQQHANKAGAGSNGSSSSQRLSAGMPAGWQLLVAGVPVAGGLVGQLADLQVRSVLPVQMRIVLPVQVRIVLPACTACTVAGRLVGQLADLQVSIGENRNKHTNSVMACAACTWLLSNWADG